jgi:hypothetical protein
MLGKSDLLAGLKSAVTALDLGVHDAGDDGLTGERDAIRTKWFLGGRKLSYRMSCRAAEAERVLHFREMIKETWWGIPPPTFTVETTKVSGWKRSGTRTDHSLGGGGAIDYAEVRNKVEAVATAAGWQFHLEGGRIPSK